MTRVTAQSQLTLFRASRPERELSLSAILTLHHEPELMDFVFAILKGFASGIESLSEIVLNPIDNLLYPISELLFDATVIAVHHISCLHIPHSEYKKFAELKSSISSQLYDASMQRMKDRLTHLNNAYRRFEKAPALEKIENISGAIAKIYVPGSLMRGANIENTFVQNGFREAIGKYREIPLLGKRQAPGTTNVLPSKSFLERNPVSEKIASDVAVSVAMLEAQKAEKLAHLAELGEKRHAKY